MTGLADLFGNFRRDAWRLEALDTYNIPRERNKIAEYLRTGRVAPSPDWVATIRAASARGARVGRVRLVGWPLTDYTRFEYAAYANNSAAGEDIRLVDRRWLDDSWNAAPDFWLVDDQAWLMRYDRTGAFLGVDLAPDAAPYIELRARIEPLSVPLAEYALGEIPAPRPSVTAPVSLPAGLALTG